MSEERQSVVVVIEGGIVQDVYSSEPLVVVVVDCDFDAEEERAVSVHEPHQMAAMPEYLQAEIACALN